MARHRRRCVAPAVRPPASYVIPDGAYFSFPNRRKAEQLAIRNRVLQHHPQHLGRPARPAGHAAAVQRHDPDRHLDLRRLGRRPGAGGGAQPWRERAGGGRQGRQQGDHGAWKLPPQAPRHRTSTGPDTRAPATPYSFARQCRGSCRGSGRHRAREVLPVRQGRLPTRASRHRPHLDEPDPIRPTRASGTRRQVMHSTGGLPRLPERLPAGPARAPGPPALPRAQASAASSTTSSRVPGASRRQGPGDADPEPRATAAAPRSAAPDADRTRIRIIQYAMYGDRGVWIAKKLRYLWNHGCDLGIIYSVSSRPVLQILRNGSGRGPVPMRQSVVKNSCGRDREVQPQQVDDDHRPLGLVHRGVRDLHRLRQLVLARLRLRRADAEHRRPRPTPCATGRTFEKTWRQGSSRPARRSDG